MENTVLVSVVRTTAFFITMMKRKGKSDKLIAEITGHSDMKTLNQQYQVSDEEVKEAVKDTFDIDIPLKKID